jgi:5-methylcytosine-specific restriction protein A
MSRAVPEWIGKTPDTAIPARVRLRVFERCEGRCHRCRRKLTPSDKWSIEHLIAIANGGRHAEDNMAISCEWCKPLKDAEDVAIKAKGARIRARHAGIRTKSPWASRPLGTGNHQHTATKPLTKRVRQFARAHGDRE